MQQLVQSCGSVCFAVRFACVHPGGVDSLLAYLADRHLPGASGDIP